jgi:ankyrin repeat protein
LLVQRGASVDVFTEKQETPLYHAAMNGKVAIAHLLIDHGANLHSADSNGCTLLHAASQGGHLEVVKLLLRRGADVDVLDKANKTAAEMASENGQAEVAKLIVEYKADANIRNKIRSTTLDTAEYGANEDGKDEGKGSLHAAAEEGNIDIMKSLLGRGMDINCRNSVNQTPLDRAALAGNRAVPARLGLETPALARLLGAPAFHVVELSCGPWLRVFHGSAQPRPRLRLHNHFISEHDNQYATSIKIFYLPVLQEVNYSHSLTHTWPHHPSPDCR